MHKTQVIFCMAQAQGYIFSICGNVLSDRLMSYLVKGDMPMRLIMSVMKHQAFALRIVLRKQKAGPLPVQLIMTPTAKQYAMRLSIYKGSGGPKGCGGYVESKKGGRRGGEMFIWD